MAGGCQGGQQAHVGALVAQGGTETPAAVHRAQPVQRQTRAGGVQPAGFGEVAEAQTAAPGERMGIGQQDVNRLLRHPAGGQRRHVGQAQRVAGSDRAVDQAQVGGAGGDGREDVLVAPLACSLIGHEAAVRVEPGSLAQTVIGAERTVERYFCAYGPSRHLDAPRAHGLRLSGHDEDGHVRIVELPGHPFFPASLFQPEPAGDGSRPHPMVRAPARAAVAHAARERRVSPGQPV